MSFVDELRARIARHESEAQRLQDLITHAKALLQEEERYAVGQFPLPGVVAAPATNGHRRREGSIPDVLERVFPMTGTFKFMQVVDAVQACLPDRKDRIELGKVVNSALRRAVQKGTLERPARGVYRRRTEQPA